MKIFKDLKVGDKLFCVDTEDLRLMVYEIKDIENYTSTQDSIYADFREFELITIIGLKFDRFCILKRNLNQDKQSYCSLIVYSDEKAAVRKLNVLIKENAKSKKNRV